MPIVSIANALLLRHLTEKKYDTFNRNKATA